MLELERHIEILLLNNDCVIVPNFGGFMAHRVDAQIDERDKTFLPPLRTVGFNPQLQINDSLLAQSYIEAYDISYPEALRKISQEVEELKFVLESKGSYNFNNIGTLALDESGRYQFTPCEAGILTPCLYGLGTFQMSPLSQILSKETQVATLAPIPAPLAAIDTNTEDPDEEEEKVISIKMSIIRNIAVACVILLVFLLTPTPLNNGTSAASSSSIDTNLLQKIMPKEQITNGVSNQDIYKATVKVASEKKLKDSFQTIAASKASPYYSLVLASRITKKNAEHYMKQLHARGYSEAEIIISSHNVKVVLGRYKNEHAARVALNKLNNKPEFSDCWITKID